MSSEGLPRERDQSEGAGWVKCSFQQAAGRSGGLADHPAADTAGTYEEPLDAAPNHGADVLQVRVPSPLGLVVGVADDVAHRGVLAANRTMSHRNQPWRRPARVRVRRWPECSN